MGRVLVNLFCPYKCGSGGYDNYLENVVNEFNIFCIIKYWKIYWFLWQNGKKVRKRINIFVLIIILLIIMIIWTNERNY